MAMNRHCTQLDEINQLFLPNMRNKLMWFYQEVEDTESNAQQEPKPGPSRAATSNPSKTPQGIYQYHDYFVNIYF